MPVMFFIVSFPEQIIRLIFERGAFGPDSTAMTAELLSVYNAGIGSALVVFMRPCGCATVGGCGGRRPGRHSQCIARSDGLRTAGRLDTRFGYPRGAERPEQRIGCPRRSRCDCRYDRTFGGRRNPAHGSDPECTETVLQFDMDEHIRFLLSLFGRYLGLEHAGTDVSAGSGGEYPAGDGRLAVSMHSDDVGK